MKNPTTVYTLAGVKRPNYFHGKLLTADDLNAEQEYHIAKHRQLTRACLGVGVVQGLGISGDGARVNIAAGMAVDAHGRLLELPCECFFELPANQGIWEIYLELVDEPRDPVPRLDANEAVGEAVKFKSIQEVVKVWIVDRVNTTAGCEPAHGVALGRIRLWNGQREVIEVPRRQPSGGAQPV